MKRLIIAFLLFVIFPSACFCQDSAEIQKLVKQLQSLNPAQRDRAEKALIERGGAVVNSLPDISMGGIPAELKLRVQRIRQAIETEAATDFLSSGKIQPGNRQTPLNEWFAEQSSVTGNKIDTARVPQSILALPVGQIRSGDFWPAMDAVVENNNLKYSWFERPKAIRLIPNAEKKAPAVSSAKVVYNGPFRLELEEIGTTIRPANPAGNTVRTSLILSWEPRLHPIYFDFQPQMRYADGSAETGESLQILGGEGNAKPLDFIFPLNQPVELGGTFSVIIAGEKQKFTFPASINSTDVQSQRKDQAVVALKSVTRSDNKTLCVQIAVEFDQSHGGLRSYMTWLNANSAVIETTQGTKIPSSDWETVWQSERGAQVKYYFPADTSVDIQKVEYLTPASIRKIEYNFKFDDIFPK